MHRPPVRVIRVPNLEFKTSKLLLRTPFIGEARVIFCTADYIRKYVCDRDFPGV